MSVEVIHPQLVVLNGRHKGDVIVLDQPLPCVLGTRAGLSLPEPELDAVHCQVFPSQGRWYLQDFGSKGGTFLGDDRVEGIRPLEFGRSFRIGDTLVALVLPDPGSPADPDFLREAEDALRASVLPARELDLEVQPKTAPPSDDSDVSGGLSDEDEDEDEDEDDVSELFENRAVQAKLVETNDPDAVDAPVAEPIEAPIAQPIAKRKKRKKRRMETANTDVFELDVPPPTNELSEQDSVGGYEVIQALGQGSVARAYKCYDRKRRRVVTLKVLDPDLARDEKWVARFLRGAKAGARLQHRSIVSILGAGHAKGRIYVVQDYVEAADLDAYCEARGGSLDPALALGIASRVTEALVYAHGRKVIHRAVSPSNILISPDGRPKLTDLTFAKRVKKPRDLNTSGAFQVEARTPYTPPEALLEATQIGARADIYGVGACLFRALTGSPPYGSDLGNVASRMLQNSLEPWGPAERVSDELRDLLRVCLRPDVEQRYTAMRDLRDAIADLPETVER